MMELSLELDFEWQREIVASQARIRTLMGGRGVAKTTGVGRPTLVSAALSNIDHLYAYFAPSYARAMSEQRKLSRNRLLKPFIHEARDQPFPYILFTSGTQVNFRTADRDDNLLGDHLNGAVIDETHKLGERFWDEIVRPQLGSKRGWALHLGQHDDEGEDGWIHKRLELPARKPDQNRMAFWRIPSSMGFMYQGEDGAAELEYIKATTNPLTFRRQYLAEPIESGNRAFRAEDLKACTAGQVQDRAVDGHRYIVGWDLGRMVDPSAYVVLDVMSREKALAVAEGVRSLGEHHADGAREAARVERIYGGARMIIDTTGGAAGGRGDDPDAVVKYYKQSIPNMRPLTINWSLKLEIVQALQLAIEQQRIQIPATLTQLHKQLGKYRWKRERHRIFFEGPNGHEDDLVMALAMAWHGVQRGWAGTAGGSPLSSIM